MANRLAREGDAHSERRGPSWHEHLALRRIEALRKRIRIAGSTGLFDSGARGLGSEHIEGCRLGADRGALLAMVPKGGSGAMIGSCGGDYAVRALEATEPRVLHLLEMEGGAAAGARAKFAAEGRVEVHDGLEALKALGDARLDWVHIDCEQSYGDCMGKALAALPAMRRGGLLLLDEYSLPIPAEVCEPGLAKAAHELCLEHGCEMAGVVMSPWGYGSVLLRLAGH